MLQEFDSPKLTFSNSNGVGGSTDAIYLGKELDVELWFKAELSKVRSVLIRTTSPEGITRSAFMHIRDGIQQVPVFNGADPLTLKDDKEKKSREFVWSPDQKRRFGVAPLILKISAVLVALTFFAGAISGLVQLRVVLTGSMKPAINPGDLIVAASPRLVEPEVGNVVLYAARDLQGNAVTVWAHRIIAGNQTEGFTIKGDANQQADIGTVPVADIQSVVVLRIPFVGNLFNVYSLLLIFGGLLLISLANSRLKRE